MTRDEAITKLKQLNIMIQKPEGWTVSASGMVDSLEALGLLNLDEPKTAQQRAYGVMKSYMSEQAADNLLGLLGDAGLKIVEK